MIEQQGTSFDRSILVCVHKEESSKFCQPTKKEGLGWDKKVTVNVLFLKNLSNAHFLVGVSFVVVVGFFNLFCCCGVLLFYSFIFYYSE